MARTTALPLIIIAAVFLAALPSTTGQSPAAAPLLSPLAAPAAPGPSVFAPSPGPDCFTYLLNLSDCLTFVQPDSKIARPDPGCCSELSNLVDTQPICLCQLLGNPGQVGLTIDVHRALKLPSVCNVTTPPVSLCAAIGIPVGALAPSEGPSAAIGSPAGALSPISEDMSPGGSAALGPSSGENGSGSPSNLASKQHFLFGLAVVLLASFL